MVRRPSALARRLQWVLLAGVVLLGGGIIHNAAGNLAARHLGFSFDYLWAPANFDIPFHLLPWATSDSFGRVLLVGLCNTLLVSVFGIIGASLLGLLVGVMRLSVNGLLRLLATCFVELIRNTPQLVQIVFWYVAVLQALPSPRQSIVIPPGLLLNVRGLYAPWPIMSAAAEPLLAGAALMLLLGVVTVAKRGWRWTWLFAAAAGLAVLPIQHFDWPVVGGFNVRGGAGLPPEFVALWLGLTTYSAAFIAEIVRGAVQAVPHGQVEAAQALGLRPYRILAKIVLPQAARMMVPPLTSQYLNLVKSSSLGAAIAFPEIFQIFGGTALNQSGREIETMSLIVAVFLGISLTISGLMNAYNRHVRFPGAVMIAGCGRWLRRNLFSSIANTGLTLLAVVALATIVPPFLHWAVFAATAAGVSPAACTGGGACWTFIRLRLPLLVYGHYPAGEIWRVHLSAAILALICIPLLRPQARHRGWMLLLLITYPAMAGVLLVGDVGPLLYVDPDNWGGLMLNVIITVLVTVLALPFGIALALGRQSPLRVVRTLSVFYIEFWRGLPLLGVLFISAVMLPLFLPQGFSIGRLLRAVSAMALFNAAYIAEVVRGGLVGVDAGQEEAAASLGMRAWQNILLITLPQALRLSIPGLVNTVIDLFKDTTLISIIGLYELLGTISQALRDPAWPGLSREGFTFAAAMFFVVCFAISLYSRVFERRLQRGTGRIKA